MGSKARHGGSGILVPVHDLLDIARGQDGGIFKCKACQIESNTSVHRVRTPLVQSAKCQTIAAGLSPVLGFVSVNQ